MAGITAQMSWVFCCALDKLTRVRQVQLAEFMLGQFYRHSLLSASLKKLYFILIQLTNLDIIRLIGIGIAC
jgi:hypothetical protein